MKFKTTQKAVNAGFYKRICVGYCNIQTLLAFENPVAYTARREGWAADIYDMGGGVAIITGYTLNRSPRNTRKARCLLTAVFLIISS